MSNLKSQDLGEHKEWMQMLYCKRFQAMSFKISNNRSQ